MLQCIVGGLNAEYDDRAEHATVLKGQLLHSMRICACLPALCILGSCCLLVCNWCKRQQFGTVWRSVTLPVRVYRKK